MFNFPHKLPNVFQNGFYISHWDVLKYFTFPLAMYDSSNLHNPHQHVVLSIFFIIALLVGMG